MHRFFCPNNTDEDIELASWKGNQQQTSKGTVPMVQLNVRPTYCCKLWSCVLLHRVSNSVADLHKIYHVSLGKTTTSYSSCETQLYYALNTPINM